MARSLLFFTLLCFVFDAHGQEKRLEQAVQAFNNNSFSRGRSLIDTVVMNAETALSAKAWYYRGEIYQALYRRGLQHQDVRDPELIEEAYKSFLKTVELDKDETFDHIAIFKLLDFEDEILKTGVAFLNEGNFQGAYEMLDFLVTARDKNKSLIMQELNPMVYLYMGYAASMSGKNEEAKKLFYLLYHEKLEHPLLYQSFAEIFKNEEKYDSAIIVLDKGLSVLPGNMELLLEEINVYIGLNKPAKSIERLKQAIRIDSINHELHFTLAAIYEGQGDEPKAIKHYKKAILHEPDYLDANYNLAVLYYNKAIEVNKLLNTMEFNREYALKLEERNSLLALSKPYFEKCYHIDPDNKQVLKVLLNIKKVLERE